MNLPNNTYKLLECIINHQGTNKMNKSIMGLNKIKKKKLSFECFFIEIKEKKSIVIHCLAKFIN